MDKKLEGILDILQVLNSNSNSVKQEELKEQYDNLEDFRELSGELDRILSEWGVLDRSNPLEIEDLLFELHRILTTLEWHFSEVSELNATILKTYKDKMDNV
ncbi:hypothetical protein [Rossellomorea marisflavi]|uniref:hypothetical protein n=1 Tax=Rossellomorea marisflavi TaxID=189381 RepID=UPI003459F843